MFMRKKQSVKELNDFVREHKDSFYEKFEDWDTYCYKMQQEGSRGGQLELLCATHIYKTSIRVFTADKWFEPS
jgi:hypothetical protein